MKHQITPCLQLFLIETYFVLMSSQKGKSKEQAITESTRKWLENLDSNYTSITQLP